MASSRKADSGHGKTQPPDLPQALARWWCSTAQFHGPPRGLVVAYSGGADSSALLHALQQADIGVPLHAVHVHHGLHPAADDWQRHCEATCQQLNVPLTVVRLTLPDSSENTARTARYQALQTHLRNGEALLTAHHRDDQAETVLHHLMRGSGLPGAAGIAPWQPWGTGWLARPLLGFGRQQLVNWLKYHGLPWVDDPSNNDLEYRRNFLRHDVLPRLHNRWPRASAALARHAQHARSAWTLLQHFYQQHGPEPGHPLPLSSFQSLPADTHGTWLALWLTANQHPLPSDRQLNEFMTQCHHAQADRQPSLALDSKVIICWKKAIYLVEKEEINTRWRQHWDGQSQLKLPGKLGHLQLTDPAPKMPLDLLVRFYQGGERILLPGHSHHKSLKKLFQEQAIPPWQRRSLPLVFHCQGKRQTLVAVAGHWLAGTAPFQHLVWHRTHQPPRAL